MRGSPVSLAEILTGIAILLSGLRGNVYIQLPLPGPFFTHVSIVWNSSPNEKAQSRVPLISHRNLSRDSLTMWNKPAALSVGTVHRTL
jgi:hypothetical protein